MKRFIRNVQLASLSGLFVFGLTSAAMANTLFVPSQYAQIQDAINAAQEGDTVFVEAGQYEIIDAIHMKEKVNLIGADNQSVVLNGLDEAQPVIYGASNSMLAGFKIIKQVSMIGPPNYGIAILADHVRQMVIKNNIITGHMLNGISLYHSHFNVVENNIVKASAATKAIQQGLHLESSSYNYILNNSVAGFSAGIYSIFGTNNKMEHNFARHLPVSSWQSSGGAIHLFNEHDSELLNNTCINMTPNLTPGAGLLLEFPQNIQVNNCLIYGKRQGLYVNGDSTHSVTIKYSNIKGDLQDVLLGGSVPPPTYGEGVLFFAPKVNLVNGKISVASPCRNSGDPTTPNDPDESRSDMGAFYYTPDTVQPPQPKR